ncbi:MAG: maleylpyruvate isomerase N-terminal domain-containing protein [Acidobacteriota bacterium]
MQPLEPIYTAGLFAPLLAELVDLLRGIPAEAWEKGTLAPAWKVRDVAAHLLDGDLRKIAVYRDGHSLSDRNLSEYRDLVGFINELNAGGVAWGRRLSPRLLVDLLDVTGRWISALVLELPPHGESIFPVDWAGESRSENWMDTGREYTERWHHQMQIRDAVGAHLLLDERWLRPLLDVSVRALPRAYAGVHAAPGTVVALEVEGVPALRWSVVADGAGWRVVEGVAPDPAAVLRGDADTLWRLFYNALPESSARDRLRVSGDAALVEPLLRARSVLV